MGNTDKKEQKKPSFQKELSVQKKSNGGTASKAINLSARQQLAQKKKRRRSLGRRVKVKFTMKKTFYGSIGIFDSYLSDLKHEAQEFLVGKLPVYNDFINFSLVRKGIISHIQKIHKHVILTPEHIYAYRVSIDFYPDNDKFEVFVMLKDEKKHIEAGIEAKNEIEESIKDKARMKVEATKKFNTKYEKIYDKRIEVILPLILERKAKKFRRHIQNIENQIVGSHQAYRQAYSEIGVVGQISSAAAFNFGRPELDQYWIKALKSCEAVASKEELIIKNWKMEQVDKYKKMDTVSTLPWHVKDNIKNQDVIDEWIEGRGTQGMIETSIFIYESELRGRLFDATYGMEQGEEIWNKWLEESYKGAGRMVTGLTVAKNAGGVAVGVIGGAGIGVGYAMVQEGASQYGEHLSGSDKAFNLWKIGKAGILAYYGAKLGDIAKKVSIYVDGIESVIPKSCMAQFLTESAVAEVIKAIDKEVSKNKTPDEMISMLVEHPTLQNVFQRILRKCK